MLVLMKRLAQLGLLGLSCSGFALVTARSASAQSAGFAIDRFQPAERGSDWFAADSLDLRGSGRLILGATGDWGYKPLVLYAPNGDEEKAVIQNQFFAHLGADVLIANRLRLGVNVPIAVYQSGDDATIGTTTFKSSNATAIGDIRLAADLRLIGEYRGPIQLAIGLAAYLPTGSQDAFTGDGKVRLAPRLLVAGEVGAFVYAAQAGFLYRANDSGFDGAATGSEVFVTAAAGLRVADERLVLGPELYGSTNVTSGDAFFAQRTSPFEVLFGAHYMATRDVRIGAGFGPGLTRGIGAPEFRGLVSLEYAPAIAEPVAEKPRELDRDHDGILDAEDACPDVPGIRTEDPTTNGCPPPEDRDKDGILDADDACPDEPGVKTDDPKTNGCPAPKDRDKDGILDADDACPDAPGPANPDPKKNGCPAARVESGQIKILERVEFENNSAKLRPASDGVLNAVLDVLTSHPEFGKLGVEGHTDNHGAAAYNKRLSEQRAASVMKWLIDHGVARARLSAQGFGLERPIDTNNTEEGRQNNRRVEFHILEVDGKAVETP